MDNFSIIFSTIGAATGLILGAILASNIKSTNIKNIVMIVPTILLVQISGTLAKNQLIRDIILKPTRIELLTRDSLATLLQNPNFRKVTSNMDEDEIQSFIQQQTNKGLKRLSFKKLKQWNNLRIKLAQNNNKICTDLWTGKINRDELIDNLKTFNNQDLMLWIDISTDAANLEINTPPLIDNAPHRSLQHAFEAIAAGLKKDETKRFTQILQQGLKAKKNDGCWALIKVLKGAKKLTDPQHEMVLRALASA